MGKTPTAVNVAIGFDIDELRNNSQLARGELNKFINDARRAMTDMEKFAVKKDVVDRMFGAGDINQATRDRMMGFYQQQYGIPNMTQIHIQERLKAVEAERKEFEKLQAHMASMRTRSIQMEHSQKVANYESERAKQQSIEEYLSGLRTRSIQMEHQHKVQTLEAERAKQESIKSYLSNVRQNSLAMEHAIKVEREHANMMHLAGAAARIEATEQSRLKSLLDMTTTATQRQAETIRFLNDMFQRGAISVNQYREILKALKNEQQGGSAGGSMTGTMASLFGPKALATGAAITVVYGLVRGMKEMGTYSLSTAIELERVNASMVTLTGSTITAIEKMAEFRRLDRESPLNFMDFAKGARTLMGFGVEAKKTESIMRSLSAISMGNSERFQSLSLAVGQVAASTKLAGQEILQMVNAGFNPLQEISRITGESMSELKKKVEAGQVSFQEVEIAIRSATEAGGRFYGMNEQLKDTLGGQMDKLKSDIMMIAAEFGESLVPAAREFVSLLSAMAPAAGTGAAVISHYADSIGLLMAMFKERYGITGSVDAYLDRLNDRAKDREFERLVSERAKMTEQEAINAGLTTREEIEQLRVKKEQEAQAKRMEEERKQELSDRDELGKRISESFAKIKFGERQWLKEKLGLFDQDATLAETAHAFSKLAMYDEEQAIKKKMKMEEDILRLKEQQAEEQRKMVEKQAEEISDLKEKHDPQLKAMREMFKLSQMVRNGLDPAIADKAGLDVAKALMQATGQGVSSQAPRVVSAGENRLMAQRMERQMKQQEEAKKIFADMLTKLRGIEEAMKAGPVLRDGRRPF